MINWILKKINRSKRPSKIQLCMYLADGMVWEIKRIEGYNAVIRNTENLVPIKVPVSNLVKLPELVDVQRVMQIGESVNKVSVLEDASVSPSGEILYKITDMPVWLSLETVMELRSGGEEE